MRADLKSIEDCKADSENCAAGARKFVAVTRSAAELGLRTRVEAINRDVNYAIRYVETISSTASPICGVRRWRRYLQASAIAKIMRSPNSPCSSQRACRRPISR